MSKRLLTEYLAPISSNQTIITEGDASGKGKHMYMVGMFIEGEIRNHNGRIYPAREIERAVKTLNETIQKNGSVLGEADHPADLKINLDRVSHMITEMWIENNKDGHGKLKLLPTPMGELIKTMLQAEVKLGVSSRGSGDVNDYDGKVSGFEIITVDIVATPSAPNAWPTAIYESLMNMKHGHKYIDNTKHEDINDIKVQKYIKETMIKLVKDLKLK